jgi:hypothetical protein
MFRDLDLEGRLKLMARWAEYRVYLRGGAEWTSAA